MQKIMVKKAPSRDPSQMRKVPIYTKVTSQEKREIEALLHVYRVTNIPGLFCKLIRMNRKKINEYLAANGVPSSEIPAEEEEEHGEDLL